MFIHTKKTRLEVVVDMRNEYTWKGWVFLPLVVENFYTLCAVDCWQVCWLVVISIDIRLGKWNCAVESNAKKLKLLMVAWSLGCVHYTTLKSVLSKTVLSRIYL